VLGYAVQDICSDTSKCPDAVVLPPAYFNAPFLDEAHYYTHVRNSYGWWSEITRLWHKLTQDGKKGAKYWHENYRFAGPHEATLAFQDWGEHANPVAIMRWRAQRLEKEEKERKSEEASKGGNVGTADL